MIRSFRRKDFKLLFEKGDRRKLRADHADKVERILARLEEASAVVNMELPGFRLHPLKGKLAGYWSVVVSGNWRVIFRFEEGHAKMDLHAIMKSGWSCRTTAPARRRHIGYCDRGSRAHIGAQGGRGGIGRRAALPKLPTRKAA